MNEFISENIQDNILRVTLNNPSTQNTLSLDMIRRLQTVFENADKNHDIKVIILASSGKIFCAGHNLKEINNHRSDPDKGLGFFTILINSCSELMLTILHNSKPVIAEVNGVATAAGCQLVASCDLAYASTNAKFATPGVNIGLFCSTPMVALSRAVKNKHSMEMLLTGDLIKAEKAIEIGLINNIFINKDLTKEVNLIAELISKKSSLTLKVGKKAFYEQSGMKIVEAYKYASEVMIKNMMEVESEEGISAFIEKRKPNWD
ncbi:MAG: enoyl-CoA hydratase [Pelagibacteraceae bacterium]|jgi:enoyl-CoA hydratase/carnithine racemase|nr:enoyl-CoA hydratase [Pelagibacteraceae bacterium]MBT4951510.1 enoyl-CoA hydratase [Pelagibacteraceae bacterium]MBT5215002.1 enoyl-CoA hydratase [Pelagibacteraceae bacterium]